MDTNQTSEQHPRLFRFSLRHRETGQSREVTAATLEEACRKIDWHLHDVVVGRRKLMR